MTCANTRVVITRRTIKQHVSTGRQGPAGGGGQQGGTFARLAGTPLSALVVVWENADGEVQPLDYRDADHIDLLAGITTTAAPTVGSAVQVQLSGVLNISGLGLSPGPVWLGANGTLTQTPPEDGFDVLVGRVVNDQRLYLSFTEHIHLET